jgi:hypothetical protein
MEFNFGYDEMKNFIIKSGKYKIVNVKCWYFAPRNWSYNFQLVQEEDYMEVAYLIDDIETEKWLLDNTLTSEKRKDYLTSYSINGVFYKEMRNKLLNL